MSHDFDLLPAGSSWLHRMDPRAKLGVVLCAGAAGLLYRHILALAALLAVCYLVLLSARIPAARLRWLWTRIAPLLVMILLLQPLVSPGAGPDLLRVGPLRLTAAGLLDGVSFALRAAALTFVAALLLLTTHPVKLVQGLVRLGLPYAWGLTVGLAVRYLPTTLGLFTSIGEAQQARGWAVGQGGLLRQARAYLPILVATVIAALRLSDSLGMALAARGLGLARRRSELHPLRMAAGDWLAVALAGSALACLLVLRFGLGVGGRPW